MKLLLEITNSGCLLYETLLLGKITDENWSTTQQLMAVVIEGCRELVSRLSVMIMEPTRWLGSQHDTKIA